MIVPPSQIGVEEIVVNAVLWLKLLIEAIGALVIYLGMILAGLRLTRINYPPRLMDFNDVRLILARFLAIALEFQLGADILSTAVAAKLGCDREIGSNRNDPNRSELLPQPRNA